MAVAASSSPSMTGGRSCAAGFWTCPRVRPAFSAWAASAASPPKSFRKLVSAVSAPLPEQLRIVSHASQTGARDLLRANKARRRHDGGLCFAVIPGRCEGIEPGISRFEDDASQKALRIDVDLELEVALGLRTDGEPLPQIVRQV